jgi:hypothetical protein
MLLIRQFNEKFSVRKATEFGSPRIIPLERLQIPRGSVFHTFDETGATLAPPASLPYFAELERPPLVRHHFKLNEQRIRGRFKIVPVQGQERQILAYHRENRRFRRAADERMISEADSKVLIVENYTPILPHYAYPDEQMAPYNRVYNYLATMVAQMAEDAANYERQNYYFIQVPNSLPSWNKFDVTYNDRVINKLEQFTDLTMLLLLELFGWFKGDVESGMFNGLDITQLDRMNFVLIHNAGFTSFNMGLVHRLRQKNGGRFTEDQMSRKFYATLIAVMTQAPNFEYDAELTTGVEGDDVEQVEATVDVTSVVDDDDDIDELLNKEEGKTVPEPETASFDEDKDIVVGDAAADLVEDKKPTEIKLEEVINHTDIIRREIEKLSQTGRLSVAAYRKLNEGADSLAKLKNPYDPNESYIDGLTIPEEKLKVVEKQVFDSPTMLDKTWTMNTTDEMRRTYNQELLKKDVLAAVASSMRLGLIVHDHTIDEIVTVGGAYEQHIIRVQPIGAAEATTAVFRIPKLTEDGTWIANGTEYGMRSQRVDKPIRKVKHDTVSLTTAYGKNFVTRSTAKVADYSNWLGEHLVKIAVDKANRSIVDAIMTNVWNPLDELPLDYTAVARRLSNFKGLGYTWSFDYTNRTEQFSEGLLKSAEEAKLTPVGQTKGVVLGMDGENIVYKVAGKGVEAMGRMAEIFDVPGRDKSPKPFTQLSIMGKELSVGFIFCYYYGLAGMLDLFKMHYEILPAGKRLEKTDYDMVIRLADAKYVVVCDNVKQHLLLNGLNKYLKSMVVFTESEMNREDVYLNLIMDVDGLTARYLQELTRMRNGFVDDMHARVLRQMREPVTFEGLLARATEMLVTDRTKPEINREEMMFLGNQRIANHIYTGLARAMRNYESQPASSRRFELSDSMVWGEIVSDPSVLITPGANPIQAITEKDIVTMGGTGGRSALTMTYHTRKFQKDELGVVSGDTVDNGDVGIIAMLTSNPEFATVDGVTTPPDYTDFRPANMLSFVNGLAPNVLTDDGKRRNFIRIQMCSGTTFNEAYATPYRTGLEMMVAHRSYGRYAGIIQQPGVVKAVSRDHIEVELEDKTIKRFPIGTWYGNHEGVTYPHRVVTRWRVGDKLPAKSVVTYDTDHFEPDLYNKHQVNWKNGRLARVFLLKAEEVDEDSNTTAMNFANTTTARTTKTKNVVINSNQVLLDLIKEGTEVDSDTILCTFSDDINGSSEQLSADAAATLAALSQYTPRAGVHGILDRVEVIYNGEIEDMSPTLITLVRKHDVERRRLARLLDDKNAPKDGRVENDYRVDGIPLGHNQILVRFYLTYEHTLGPSDKLVIANQLKTTIQESMVGINRTEDGRDGDICFGRESVDARIVGSVSIIGSSTECSLTGGEIIEAICEGTEEAYEAQIKRIMDPTPFPTVLD